LFHCQNKTNIAVRYGNIFIFLFTLLPKQSNWQNGSSQGDESSSQVIWPAAPLCSSATAP